MNLQKKPSIDYTSLVPLDDVGKDTKKESLV